MDVTDGGNWRTKQMEGIVCVRRNNQLNGRRRTAQVESAQKERKRRARGAGAYNAEGVGRRTTLSDGVQRRRKAYDADRWEGAQRKLLWRAAYNAKEGR